MEQRRQPMRGLRGIEREVGYPMAGPGKVWSNRRLLTN